ncbi:MAG: Crp/Fnr family transcriptional regulator [Desulfacinum sp.]|jgi:CRP/FNR family transcriptional regulator|nr:Crp/Fnr family transcriptional regulator [Desulfacinum sp.]MBZ4658841.1 Crp/Fnr family transcriptional regulator [Desulfacinum sp.]
MGCLCEELLGKDVPVSPECIGNLWLFRNLEPEDIQALVSAAERRIYQAREVIFHQGDPAQRMFLIKAGRVKLSKVHEDGHEITLDLRKSGDFLGEQMLSEESDYPVSAVCMERTLICGFTRKRFEALVRERPNIGLQVIRNLSERIHLLTDRAGSLSFSNLEDRLYRILVAVAKEHGKRTAGGYAIHFPLTHEELSFLVGAHRVSITRAMGKLRESGRISIEGRTLLICEEPWS